MLNSAVCGHAGVPEWLQVPVWAVESGLGLFSLCIHQPCSRYAWCPCCRYYGLLAQRFCYLKREYQEVFEDCFRRQYNLIHRLETNKLRNVAKFFAHLLATDAVSWGVLSNIVLTEDATTSSARIFIKILFQVRCEPCCAASVPSETKFGRTCWL